MRYLFIRSVAVVGLFGGLATLSVAMGSVPTGRVTDDTAIYQNLSEIRVPKQANPDFDGDIARLSGMENRYRERLPALGRHAPRVGSASDRVARQQYRFSGKSVTAKR